MLEALKFKKPLEPRTLQPLQSEAPVGSQASDKDGTKFLASKAEIINELEQSMPRRVRKPSW